MASYEKLHDSELEAGRTMDLDNNTVLVVDEKRQDEEPSTSEDSSRRSMSPLKRAFAVVFIFAFIGFSLLRGVALVSVHCISSKYSQLGNHPELMEDEAFMEALRSISPEEYCKLYAEYCPDKNEPPMDTWEPIPAMDEVAVDLSDAEPAIEASLDKRQDTGNNSTVTQPPTSDSSSSSSGPTSSPTTSDDDDDGETTTSSQPPPPPPVTTTTTTEAPPPPPSTTTTSSSTEDDDESSTTTQGPTSVPTSTSEVESTSTTSERPSSAEDDETSSTPRSSSSRRTVTSGTITTTSAERHTITSTLPDGEPTTITSTTWVEFVPEETAQSENDPDLQGSASGWERSTHLQMVMGVFVGGLLMI